MTALCSHHAARSTQEVTLPTADCLHVMLENSGQVPTFLKSDRQDQPDSLGCLPNQWKQRGASRGKVIYFEDGEFNLVGLICLWSCLFLSADCRRAQLTDLAWDAIQVWKWDKSHLQVMKPHGKPASSSFDATSSEVGCQSEEGYMKRSWNWEWDKRFGFEKL